MTLHAVIGEGSLPKKELTATLLDLLEKSTEEDADFWFLLQGKAEPTDTDKAVVEWLEANQIYYEVFTDDGDSLDAIYESSQNIHVGKRLVQKVTNILKGAEDQQVDLLALFVNTQEDDVADQFLLDMLQSAIDAEIPCFGLNDSMTQIDLSDGGDEDTPAEEPVEVSSNNVTPIKKAASKRAATPKPGPIARTPERAMAKAEARALPEPHTREELEELTDAEVRAIGGSLGIATRGRENWISKILDAQKAVQDEEPGPTLGDEESGYEEQVGPGYRPEAENGAGPVVVIVNPKTASVIVKPLTEEMANLLME